MQGPLLNSIWVFAVAYSFTVFIVCQAFIRYDQLYSDNPICDYPAFTYVANDANLVQGGGFAVVFFVLISNYFTLKHDVSLFGSLVTTLCVSFLAGAATFMSILWNWGGICEDGFGVKSPAVMWGEWIACVPLIFLIVIATERKPSLTFSDGIILLLVFLSMCLACIMNINLNFGVNIALLILSSCFITVALILLVRSNIYSNNAVLSELIQDSVNSNLLLKKKELTINLLIIIPTFPIVYFLCAFKFIDNNDYAVLLIICNSLTKLIFTAQVLGAHVHVISIMHTAEVQSNQARRAFLRFIMHEVRIPLNSMTMGINLLSESTNLMGEEKEALLTMESAAGFMRETLNDILSIQKIEEGKLELVYQPFSIRDILHKVKATLQGILNEKHIQLVINIAEDVPKIFIGDCFRIQHVIVNLVSNSIKFSVPDSEVIINISIAIRRNVIKGENEHLHCTLIVAVTDHGAGISERDQKKLFQPFMQIRPGELQDGGGSGIGLSLCKQIIELHGGTIECQSMLGQGSTFAFKLPLAIGSPIEKKEEVLIGSVKPPTSPLSYNGRLSVDMTKSSITRTPDVGGTHDSFQTSAIRAATSTLSSTTATSVIVNALQINKLTRIGSFDDSENMMSNNLEPQHHLTNKALITDDVPSNSKMLRMLLRKRGYDSIIAQNGKEAVDIVKGSFDDFDLIFMDNMMPIMNGLQATRELRAMGYRKLIIGLTGNALDVDVQEFLEAGANKVLLKPLRCEQLDDLLAGIRKKGPQFTLTL